MKNYDCPLPFLATLDARPNGRLVSAKVEYELIGELDLTHAIPLARDGHGDHGGR